MLGYLCDKREMSGLRHPPEVENALISSHNPLSIPLSILHPRVQRSSRLIHWLIHLVPASFMISRPFTATSSPVHANWN